MPAEIRGKQPNKNCEERYQRIIFIVKVCEFGSLVHNLLLLNVSYILKDQRRAQFLGMGTPNAFLREEGPLGGTKVA